MRDEHARRAPPRKRENAPPCEIRASLSYSPRRLQFAPPVHGPTHFPSVCSTSPRGRLPITLLPFVKTVPVKCSGESNLMDPSLRLGACPLHTNFHLIELLLVWIPV